MKKTWTELSEQAKQELFKANDIKYGFNFIELIYEPSFENHFKVVIKWNNGQVLWKKTTWDTIADSPKFNDIMESLKYIGLDLEPTILIENGDFDKKEINDLVSLIMSMNIDTPTESDYGITLDGYYARLIVRIDNLRMTYSWHTLPKNWQILEEILEKIIQLEKVVNKYI